MSMFGVAFWDTVVQYHGTTRTLNCMVLTVITASAEMLTMMTSTTTIIHCIDMSHANACKHHK